MSCTLTSAPEKLAHLLFSLRPHLFSDSPDLEHRSISVRRVQDRSFWLLVKYFCSVRVPVPYNVTALTNVHQQTEVTREKKDLEIIHPWHSLLVLDVLFTFLVRSKLCG